MQTRDVLRWANSNRWKSFFVVVALIGLGSNISGKIDELRAERRGFVTVEQMQFASDLGIENAADLETHLASEAKIKEAEIDANAEQQRVEAAKRAEQEQITVTKKADEEAQISAAKDTADQRKAFMENHLDRFFGDKVMPLQTEVIDGSKLTGLTVVAGMCAVLDEMNRRLGSEKVSASIADQIRKYMEPIAVDQYQVNLFYSSYNASLQELQQSLSLGDESFAITYVATMTRTCNEQFSVN